MDKMYVVKVSTDFINRDMLDRYVNGQTFNCKEVLVEEVQKHILLDHRDSLEEFGLTLDEAFNMYEGIISINEFVNEINDEYYPTTEWIAFVQISE